MRTIRQGIAIAVLAIGVLGAVGGGLVGVTGSVVPATGGSGPHGAVLASGFPYNIVPPDHGSDGFPYS